MFSLSAVIISLLAGLSYLPVIKVPKFRRTMWPTRLLFYLSLIPAALSMIFPTDDPQRNLLLVSLTCILFALFNIFFYTALKLPVAPGRPEIGKLLPDFEVTGEDGKTYTPGSLTGKGPVLLVFFRGFW
jgi:hypothetical protein